MIKHLSKNLLEDSFQINTNTSIVVKKYKVEALLWDTSKISMELVDKENNLYRVKESVNLVGLDILEGMYIRNNELVSLVNSDEFILEIIQKDVIKREDLLKETSLSIYESIMGILETYPH